MDREAQLEKGPGGLIVHLKDLMGFPFFIFFQSLDLIRFQAAAWREDTATGGAVLFADYLGLIFGDNATQIKLTHSSASLSTCSCESLASLAHGTPIQTLNPFGDQLVLRSVKALGCGQCASRQQDKRKELLEIA